MFINHGSNVQSLSLLWCPCTGNFSWLRSLSQHKTAKSSWIQKIKKGKIIIEVKQSCVRFLKF